MGFTADVMAHLYCGGVEDEEVHTGQDSSPRMFVMKLNLFAWLHRVPSCPFFFMDMGCITSPCVGLFTYTVIPLLLVISRTMAGLLAETREGTEHRIGNYGMKMMFTLLISCNQSAAK